MITLKITKNSVSLSLSPSLCLSTENGFLVKHSGVKASAFLRLNVKSVLMITKGKKTSALIVQLEVIRSLQGLKNLENCKESKFENILEDFDIKITLKSP